MDKRREWMQIILQEALNLGILESDDVLRHADPKVLATDLPPQLVASLLQTGLDLGTFHAKMVVEHLGAEKLATHVPLSVLWSCIQEAARTIVREQSPSSAAGKSASGQTGTTKPATGKGSGSSKVPPKPDDGESILPHAVQAEDVVDIEVMEE